MVDETKLSKIVDEFLQDRNLPKDIKKTLSTSLEENSEDKIKELKTFLDGEVKDLNEFANLMRRPKQEERLEIDLLTAVFITKLSKVESSVKVFLEINELTIKNLEINNKLSIKDINGLNEKVMNFLNEITDSDFYYSLKVKTVRDKVIRQISNITDKIKMIQENTYANPPHGISSLVSYLNAIYKVANLTENAQSAYRNYLDKGGLKLFKHEQTSEPKGQHNNKNSSDSAGSSPIASAGYS